MSRRRYISTEISTDRHLRQVSDAACLFYTWMIPHVNDDATITGDPDELAAIVVPNRKGWGSQKVLHILTELESVGLVNVVDGTLYVPIHSFYKYQSSIPEHKRRNEQPPANEDFQKKILKVAKNSASPSPSPSPLTHMLAEASVFASFWELYPRKVGKGAAEKAWASATKRASAETICAGLRRLMPSLLQEEPRYIPHPATWLNQDRWADQPYVRAQPYEQREEPVRIETTEAERAEGARIIREAREQARRAAL